ncbi:MAG: hypothetical protein GXP62_13475 [Oligoflexia bacterium]|nr:hypothetical protein [Oligoflexia bacterium]
MATRSDPDLSGSAQTPRAAGLVRAGPVRAGPVRAAWPILSAINLAIAATLFCVWLWTDWSGGAGKALFDRASSLDMAQAADALAAAEDDGRRAARALMPEDQGRTASFLSLTASAAGLQTTAVDFSVAAEGLPCCDAVDASIDLQGDIFDLPIFLDGLHRQAALGQVMGLAALVEPGGTARARVVVRYLRPHLPDPADIARRSVATAPDSAWSSLWLRAATVAAWRDAAQVAEARSAVVTQTQRRLLHELPAGLAGLRLSGGSLRWTAKTGLVTTPASLR